MSKQNEKHGPWEKILGIVLSGGTHARARRIAFDEWRSEWKHLSARLCPEFWSICLDRIGSSVRHVSLCSPNFSRHDFPHLAILYQFFLVIERNCSADNSYFCIFVFVMFSSNEQNWSDVLFSNYISLRADLNERHLHFAWITEGSENPWIPLFIQHLDIFSNTGKIINSTSEMY